MISCEQLHTGRISLNLNVSQLARLAGVAPNSIHGIERGADFKASTMQALQEALESRGVLFAAPNRVGVKMVWEGPRPATRELRDAVLAVLNASRKAKGMAPLIDVQDTLREP